jgi:hypothetical protein
VLRGTNIPKKDERIDWRRLPNEELCKLYCYSNIRMIKSRRMRWTGHIACNEGWKCAQSFGRKTRSNLVT